VRQYERPGVRILDIGCGRGGLVELLHNRVGLVVGADADMRSLLEYRELAVRRVCGLAEHLPFPDESFDLVICSWVLEHLARPELTFAEVARVLRSPDLEKRKPGGHFVFLAPNAWHPLTWINRLVGRFGGWQARLVTRLYDRTAVDTYPVVYRANTRGGATRLAEAAGLTLVDFFLIGDPTYLAFNELFYRLSVITEWLIPLWMKIHLVGDFVKAASVR
jgi:SAM-dependent methyltransferase